MSLSSAAGKKKKKKPPRVQCVIIFIKTTTIWAIIIYFILKGLLAVETAIYLTIVKQSLIVIEYHKALEAHAYIIYTKDHHHNIAYFL